LSTFVLLTITGLGLGAMYFLIASGLSLIYGLMGVLNFAHGALLTVGAYATWWTSTKIDGSAGTKLLVGAVAGLAVGAVLAALIELVLIRPLYRRPVEQVLVTVGLALALTALVEAIWGFDARPFPVPSWMIDTTTILGASIPNDRFVEIAAAAVVLVGLNAFLRFTRYGLIIRAGVENRAMVTALGIDVRKAFTLVFAIGGALAALAGVLSGLLRRRRSGPRHVASDLRLHRRRDRRLRLDRRHGRRRRCGRLDPAVRELLRVERARRPRRRAPARDCAAAEARRTRPEGGALSRHARNLVVPLVLLGVFAIVPLLSLDIPVLLGGPLDSPGTLGLLALCLVFAGVALTYDLLFGYTGLLSFGHALYFALGVYFTTIALTKWEWSFAQTLVVVVGVGIVVPLVLGAISLRVGGIAFAMVTLAFAQAGQVLVQKNPDGLTGGEEGLGLNFESIPDFFVGVLNTKYLYWLALGYAAFVFVVVRWAVNSSPGHVLQAIRENEQRVEVIGLQPFRFKLLAFVLASFLATVGGVVWLLVLGTGASPQVTTASFTLTLLVMVVIGGAGTRYGALLGGFLYTLADQRLGTLSGSSTVEGLPSVLETPLSEPLFVLGVLFILLVFFVPGGLASIGHRVTRMRRMPLDVKP
jgi:branched-chain amino acid transport system permease protein